MQKINKQQKNNHVSIVTYLVVGLGNDNVRYKYTRHNVGFCAVDFLAEFNNLSWRYDKKFSAYITSYYLELNANQKEKIKILLCKPATFMNISGVAVAAIVDYYNLQVSKVIVIQDDIETELAHIKCKIGGGSRGHNGIRSITQYIGANFIRVMIGIGRPNNDVAVADFVLANFSSYEKDILTNRLKVLKDNFHFLLRGDSKILDFKLAVCLNNV